ncbi:MAG TPA: hypothetical protein VII93_07975 [Anaerolineales bacterium]
MSENTNKVELHGCIVCGKLHNLLVVTTPGGKLVGYTVTGSSCHTLPGAERPLVACDGHTTAEVDAALSRHHPGPEQAKDSEDE